MGHGLRFILDTQKIPANVCSSVTAPLVPWVRAQSVALQVARQQPGSGCWDVFSWPHRRVGSEHSALSTLQNQLL